MEQEEICRVCRCEGSLEQPLFHPCKCSGSIKYVHQDCLMIWLTHSQRTYCELCDHRYSFSPVYRTDMPDTIPTRLFALQLAKKLSNMLYMTLRGCLVACMWLLVLPYFTVNVWRFYFRTGELFGEQLRRLQDYSATANQLYTVSNMKKNVSIIATATGSIVSTMANHTLEAALDNSRTFYNQSAVNANASTQHTLLGRTVQISTIKNLLADCMEGQVITLAVVVVFISIFHLREWIVENVPDELLEDIDDEPMVIAEEEEEEIDQQDDRPQLERHLHDIQQPPLERNENLQRDIEEVHELVRDNIQTNNDSNRLQYPFNLEHQNLTAERTQFDSRRAASEPPHSTQSQQPQHYFDDDDEPMIVNANRQHRAASAEPVMDPYSSSLYLATSSFSAQHDHQLRTDSFTNPLTGSSTASSSNQRPPHEHGENDRHQIHILDHHRRHRPGVELPAPALRHVRQETPPAAQLQQPPPPPPQFQEPAPLPQDFRMNNADGNVADDILDILDAIGMQGHLWTLVQNVAIIGMVISSSIAVTIWLPYLIGMTFVMADIFEVVLIPLLLIRMLTDPITDWIATLFMNTTWPHFTSKLASLVSATFNRYLSIAPRLIQDTLASITTKFTLMISAAMGKNGIVAPTNSSLQHVSDGASMLSLESIFDTLLQWYTHQAQPMVMNVVTWYQHLAVGTSVMDRTICIVIGYILALAMSSCYVSQALARKMFGDRAQVTLRQQYLILKVGLFLAIELFTFPGVCGLLLDFSTLSLQNDSSSSLVSQRLDHLRANTTASMIVYWFIGSGFMLMFAWIITSCRAIFRPGVLWFISDHNDPQFHPIKEIVHRPVWNHLEKLAISAVMYATIIVIGVGGSVQSIVYFGHNYLPRQWNLARPDLVIPFDLIVVQLVVPAIIHYFQPMQTIKNVYIGWMRYLCRQLRLTSFMFGIRTMDEEGTMRYDTWVGLVKGVVLQQHGEVDDGNLVWDGQLVRAPKRDGVKYIPGRRMLVPVHRTTLLPIDERDQQLGHPAAFQGRLGGEETNTMVVYMPPQFKRRVAWFVMMLWTFGAVLITSMTIVPLALGRYIFKEGLDVEEPVLDLCSYLAGIVVILAIGALMDHSATAIRDVVSHSSTPDRIHVLRRHVVDMICWISKCLFFNMTFNVILPLLIGIVVEMHFIFPWQDFGEKLPVFTVGSIWIRGFGLMNVIFGLLLVLPANTFQANLTGVLRNGITNMDVRLYCMTILIPTYVTCLYLILMPFVFGLLVSNFLVEKSVALQIKNMQLAYPICLGGLLLFFFTSLCIFVSDRWMQTIREDHFLVGRTLHNMDE